MLGYKLYLFDKTKGYELIAVLLERRKKPKRITEESVINWGRTLLGSDGKGKDIFFERVTVKYPAAELRGIKIQNLIAPVADT